MLTYLLFSGSHYYASGGGRDFIESFDTLEAAQAKGSELVANGYQMWADVWVMEDGKLRMISEVEIAAGGWHHWTPPG